ncbi:MAG: methyltransferase domain-containing protein [bacterium]|nr:methyltransferase domain-containing protein [bacterium]
MELVPEMIISTLKNEYRYEITPALEVRIHDLYDLGKISDVSDYDKIIQVIHSMHSELFKERSFVENAMKEVLKKHPVNVKILFVGSDLGESSYGALIEIERILKQSDNVNGSYHMLARSSGMAEKIKNPSFSYDEVLNADENELHYLVNKIDYYTVRKDLTEKVSVTAANPFNLAFKNNTFDCVFLFDFQRYLKKTDLHLALHEIYRVTAFDGICFTKDINMMLSGATSFVAEEADNFNYFVKRKKKVEITEESTYTFSDALDFYRIKKYQEAAMILYSLIRESREIDIELYRLLLLIYIRQGDSFKIEYTERVLKLNNVKNADFDFIIGSYYFNRNDYAKSEQYLKHALLESPNLIFAEYYLALIEKLCGKLESSRKRFCEIAEKIDENNYYTPELYSEIVSIDMINYIAKNEMEGAKI